MTALAPLRRSPGGREGGDDGGVPAPGGAAVSDAGRAGAPLSDNGGTSLAGRGGPAADPARAAPADPPRPTADQREGRALYPDLPA